MFRVSRQLLGHVEARLARGVKIVPGPVLEQSVVSLAVRKGDSEVLASVNKFIATVFSDGTMKKLAQKYNLP